MSGESHINGKDAGLGSFTLIIPNVWLLQHDLAHSQKKCQWLSPLILY
jgi:hypothetical protein